MRKYILTAFSLATIAFTSTAKVLSPTQALDRALGSKSELQTLSSENTQMKLVATRSVNAEPAIYVFSTDDSGYMLVSADDVAVPVLGIVEHGKYNETQLPPAMKSWIDEYATQIAWARENITETDAHYLPRPEYTGIAPMLSTQWNQGEPYNNYCPMVGDKRCYTGCVATALAQILAYHKYPVNGTGSLSYTWDSQTLSYDYSTANFDWDMMIDNYDDEYTDAQASAVANLMYACGVGVSMGYGTSASSASISKIPSLLSNNLGYNKSTHIEYREHYDILGWEKMIYTHLRDYGPVLYLGSSNWSGHAFVCDGYSSDGYFHINWGWGGTSDGYFMLTALDPATQGIGGSTSGYDFNHDVIANATPDPEGVTTPYYMISCGGMSVSPTSCSVGSSVSLTGGFYNRSSANFNGQFGLKLMDTKGNVSYMTIANASMLAPNYGWKTRTLKVPSDIAEGTYIITPVFCIEGGSWQDMVVNCRNSSTYLTMTVADGKANFAEQSIPTASVTDISFNSKFYVNTKFNIRAKVTNNGDSDYSGLVYGVLFNSDGSTQVGMSEGVPTYLAPGESLDIDYISSFFDTDGEFTITAGDYVFAFADINSKVVSPTYPITIADAPTESDFTFSDFAFVGDSDNAIADDIRFTATVSCTAGIFVDKFKLYIYPYIPGQSVHSLASISSETIFLSQGESTTATFRLNFTAGEPGKTYFANVYYNNTKLGKSTLFTIGSSNGVNDICTDQAEVIAKEVFSLAGTKITDSIELLSPGCYILRELLSDGSITSRRILISGK